jgi:hypothetical protein
MLLNEFLKEHRKVETLEVTVARQRTDCESVIASQKTDFESAIAKQKTDFQSAIAKQEEEITVLTATVQKVSNGLALRQAISRVAANHR